MTDPFPPGSALACYLRDSGGVSQDLSVDQQLTVIREWCDNNGYTLASIFADRARPGGTVTGRTEFDRLIRHFQSGAPEAGVVFWDLSRWLRSFDDGQFYLSTLRRLGYQVHSLEQYIPPGSIGRVVESLHLWSAEEFRKQLSHNIKRGLRYIVTVHHAYPMPYTPVGYRKEPSQVGIRRNGEPHLVNRLVPDPATRAAVLRAFELRASRQSIAEIHALNQSIPQPHRIPAHVPQRNLPRRVCLRRPAYR